MPKKSMTVKLEKDMLESVDNHCEGLGCNRTNFVIEAINEKLEGKTKETEPKTTISEVIEPKPIVTEVIEPSELKNPIIVEESIDNSKKHIIKMVEFNGEYIPTAEVYEV